MLLWDTEILTGSSSRQLSQAADTTNDLGTSGGCTALSPGHTDYVLSVAFPPTKSKIMASAGNDKKIFVWNTESKERLRVMEGHTNAINSLAFSSDATILLSTSRDRSTRVWQVVPREIDGEELWSHTQIACIPPHTKDEPDGHAMNIDTVACGFEPLEEADEEDVIEEEEESPEGETAAEGEAAADGEGEAPADGEATAETEAEAPAAESSPPAEEEQKD